MHRRMRAALDRLLGGGYDIEEIERIVAACVAELDEKKQQRGDHGQDDQAG
jgi:hypothetical protein